MIEQLYWIVHKDCEYLISLKLDIRDIGLNFVHIKIRKKKLAEVIIEVYVFPKNQKQITTFENLDCCNKIID